VTTAGSMCGWEALMNLAESLRKYATVVADTGDIKAIAHQRPQDATTNPSLLYHAAQMPAYCHLVEEAAEEVVERVGCHEQMAEEFIDRLFVLFGSEILNVVPGRVSTEVAASLSFDTAGTVAKARKLMSPYEKKGVSRERVLIEIASTWEGIMCSGANADMLSMVSRTSCVISTGTLKCGPPWTTRCPTASIRNRRRCIALFRHASFVAGVG
jgi:Transaldolase/Fructose-6-phosphate aldolase